MMHSVYISLHVYTFCLLFSYLIKVVALRFFVCCYQHVLANKDIHYLEMSEVWNMRIDLSFSSSMSSVSLSLKVKGPASLNMSFSPAMTSLS